MPKTNQNSKTITTQRMKMLKTMKQSDYSQISKSIGLVEEKNDRPLFPEPIPLSSDITFTTNRGKPKMVLPSNKRKTPFLTLRPFSVRYAQLGENGNLNAGTGRYAVTDPEKARFVLALEKGIPDECLYEMRDGLTHQQEDLNRLCELGLSGMEYAYNKNLWPELTECDIDEFLSGANISYMRTRTKSEEDDTEVDVIELKRKLTDFNGGDNRPQFWRYNNGVIEPFNIQNLPSGSLVVPTVSIRYWGFMENDQAKYGASADLGKDILVVWMPKKETKGVTSIASVPQFDF